MFEATALLLRPPDLHGTEKAKGGEGEGGADERRRRTSRRRRRAGQAAAAVGAEPVGKEVEQ